MNREERATISYAPAVHAWRDTPIATVMRNAASNTRNSSFMIAAGAAKRLVNPRIMASTTTSVMTSIHGHTTCNSSPSAMHVHHHRASGTRTKTLRRARGTSQ